MTTGTNSGTTASAESTFARRDPDRRAQRAMAPATTSVTTVDTTVITSVATRFRPNSGSENTSR